MRHGFRRFASGSLLLVLATGGCASPSTSLETELNGARQTTDSGATSPLTPPTSAVAALSGHVTMPRGVVGSPNVIAAGGGNVIAVGGANVIAAGGGNLVGSKKRRVLAAEEELPVSGATVILRDPVTRKRLTGIGEVRTDAQGRFHIPDLPANVNVLVDVCFMTVEQKPYRLMSVARPGGTEGAKVDWRSTAIASSVLQSTHREGPSRKLYVMDAAELKKAEAHLAQAFTRLAEAARITHWGDMLHAHGDVQDGRLVVAEELPIAAFDGGARVVAAFKAEIAELEQILTDFVKAVGAELSAEEHALAQQAELWVAELMNDVFGGKRAAVAALAPGASSVQPAAGAVPTLLATKPPSQGRL